MTRTSDKVLIAVLAVVFIGMTSAFIAAINSGSDSGLPEQKPFVKVIYSDDLELGESIDEDNEAEDIPISGSALDRASAAALEYIGEGRVTDTEIGDEEGYYEIEVTLNNGKEADVHLDENFNVLSVEYN
ncbi:MAG: hypothetical protein A2725_04545 [Candidatus Magasanikbacteria bacterium RIFCSPHIGHO2_01_FULL_33_34]|uniref:PepSY domain-containing protein n=1 Tax=Candidatus Magasanikbacteria bacterium RIFCSPHIGHO2_01_FULL_33_34 TaxID=1798671 RepID=A0A1F6LL10_9BACT|nr:hypothetical protein [Candidatus Pacearchaeota archaeon]OGH60005.1 MAG: hypothetical protein A2725_04545 [Candidatus Magasanikbacteria bacterium RIFCSPHIGHO2_01_FULL_33_34]